VGGQRTGTTSSVGRGLLEIEEELFNAIERVDTDLGVVIVTVAKSAVAVAFVSEQYVLVRDYLFRARLTADRYYHPVEDLRET